MNETWVSARARSCADAGQLRLLVLILSWVSRGGLWKRAVRLAQNARRFVLCGAMFRVGASGPVGRSPRIVVHCARGRLVSRPKLICLFVFAASTLKYIALCRIGTVAAPNPTPHVASRHEWGTRQPGDRRREISTGIIFAITWWVQARMAGFGVRIAGAERSQAGFAGG